MLSPDLINESPVEAATRGVLKNFALFTGKRLYQNLFFNRIAGLNKPLVQVSSSESCEIFKNTTFTEYLRITNYFGT